MNTNCQLMIQQTLASSTEIKDMPFFGQGHSKGFEEHQLQYTRDYLYSAGDIRSLQGEMWNKS
jgi:hypothetical protein